jgi:uncharacterized protein YdeI (BOF family)
MGFLSETDHQAITKEPLDWTQLQKIDEIRSGSNHNVDHGSFHESKSANKDTVVKLLGYLVLHHNTDKVKLRTSSGPIAHDIVQLHSRVKSDEVS